MTEIEEEINLYELFQVIWKRRFLIAVICLVSTLSAGIISFVLPPVYGISAIITPGFFEKNKEGENVYVDSPDNISVAIGSGSYDTEIIQSLKLDPEIYAGELGFDVKRPKKSDLITINYNSEDTDLGKKILGELLNQLDQVYSEKVELKKEKLDRSIQLSKNKILNVKNQKATIKNQKTTIKNQKTTIKNQKARMRNSKETILNEKKKISKNIGLAEKKVGLLKETEKYQLQQRIEVDKNTKTIMDERTSTLKDGEKKDAVALLLYSNTIQQNLGYLDRLNSQIDKNRLEQEIALNNVEMMKIQLNNKDTELKNLDVNLKDKDVELQNLDTKLKDKDTELKMSDVSIMNIEQNIEKLKIGKKEIEGIHVIQQPTASFNPVKPKKKLIVAMAGVIGLMASIFFVFFMEFIESQKAKLKEDNGEA